MQSGAWHVFPTAEIPRVLNAADIFVYNRESCVWLDPHSKAAERLNWRLVLLSSPLSGRTDATDINWVSESVCVLTCNESPNWQLYAWNNPNKVVYGPVSSRRLGQSLGINLFPQGKVCSYSCVYCDMDVAESAETGAAIAPKEILFEDVRSRLPFIARNKVAVDSITFAGNGEPTLHPRFPEVVREVAGLRDKWLSSVPLNLFSNGSNLADNAVREALPEFETVFLKVDGASQRTVERIDGPGAWDTTTSAINLAHNSSNIAASTVVIDGDGSNARIIASAQYTKMIRRLSPTSVYLYTLDYPTMSRTLKAVSPERLVAIALEVADSVNCPVVALLRQHSHPDNRGIDHSPVSHPRDAPHDETAAKLLF